MCTIRGFVPSEDDVYNRNGSVCRRYTVRTYGFPLFSRAGACLTLITTEIPGPALTLAHLHGSLQNIPFLIVCHLFLSDAEAKVLAQ